MKNNVLTPEDLAAHEAFLAHVAAQEELTKRDTQQVLSDAEKADSNEQPS